ncbi:hypothetical protein Sjap_008900 [Stephania japonica]|uniref:Xylanase inhibitor C-terminal domain-containing protein n=1 Tax=Stephania japonica TaxID=461633 RepID=A0AAP0JQF5_9MAGN
MARKGYVANDFKFLPTVGLDIVGATLISIIANPRSAPDQAFEIIVHNRALFIMLSPSLALSTNPFDSSVSVALGLGFVFAVSLGCESVVCVWCILYDVAVCGSLVSYIFSFPDSRRARGVLHDFGGWDSADYFFRDIGYREQLDLDTMQDLIDIPKSAFEFKSGGSGGLIIDSGMQITSMQDSDFELVKEAFKSQMELSVAHDNQSDMPSDAISNTVVPTLIDIPLQGCKYTIVIRQLHDFRCKCWID